MFSAALIRISKWNANIFSSQKRFPTNINNKTAVNKSQKNYFNLNSKFQALNFSTIINKVTFNEISSTKENQNNKNENKQYISHTQEMIISVGYPASGKTTFAERYFVPYGYIRVNRDILKTHQKCIRICKEALKVGKSVVIDNTNAPENKRKEWIEIAKEFKVKIRCFHFIMDEKLAMKMNEFREENSNGVLKKVPKIVFQIYQSKFIEPKKEEGFDDLLVIHAIPFDEFISQSTSLNNNINDNNNK